jgi:hypothetical protein
MTMMLASSPIACAVIGITIAAAITVNQRTVNATEKLTAFVGPESATRRAGQRFATLRCLVLVFSFSSATSFASSPTRLLYADGLGKGASVSRIAHVQMCSTRIAGIASPVWRTVTPSFAIQMSAREAIRAAIDAINFARVFIRGIQSQSAVSRKARKMR